MKNGEGGITICIFSKIKMITLLHIYFFMTNSLTQIL
jgi:hypothetical protein